MYTAKEKLRIAVKWAASFFQREWTLDDYPTRIRPNGDTGEWIAQILNWSGPNGIGHTKDIAMTELRKNFTDVQTYRKDNFLPMPRPGTNVPIQFASTDRVSSDPELQDDFITRVLGFEPGSLVFISDESSLSDFGDESTLEDLKKKILEIYGVDISDLERALLCDIFDRIKEKS